jgi:hypothetical protein
MKEMNLTDLDQVIQLNKTEAERVILQQKSEQRQMRTRPRDPNEIQILDKLAVLKWERAIASGKVIMLNKQEWYYECD